MLNQLPPSAPTAEWLVEVSPPVQVTPAWTEQLLRKVQPQLERRLLTDPKTVEFTLAGELLSVHLRRLSGPDGTPVRLRLSLPGPGARGAQHAGLIHQLLPDTTIAALADRLVGLDDIRCQILQKLRCAFDGALERWGRAHGVALPAVLTNRLSATTPLILLCGDPGVGKSALAQSVADSYCRESGQSGHLYWLTTATRGDGTVGNFSKQLREAIGAIERAAGTWPSFVIIDEADALAVARSETQAHQEDRAATGSLLQLTDHLVGRRVAVFLTTNLQERVDSAIQRRALVFQVPRPGYPARLQLLRHWFQGAPDRVLERAAHASAGMTPVDIERTAEAVYLDALTSGSVPDFAGLPQRLRRGDRTTAV